MKLYTLVQGGQALGTRSFADTKAFVLRCCVPALRAKVVDAKQISTLRRAIKDWADITEVDHANRPNGSEEASQ